MAGQIQSRASNLLSDLGMVARQAIAGVKERSEQRAVKARNEREAIAAGKENFFRLVRERIPHIEVGLTQADLDSVSWKTPFAVRVLLREEIKRLALIRNDLAAEAGLPMEARSPAIKKEVDRLLLRASDEMERAMLSGLDLPPYFQWKDGVLMVEDVYDDRITTNGGYVGVNSRYLYDIPPTL